MNLNNFRLVLGSRKSLGLLTVNYVFSILKVTTKLKGWPIHFANKVSSDGLIVIGEEFDLIRCLVKNSGIYIQTSNKVYIHSSVMLASGCKIISGNHDFFDLRKNSTPSPPIEIGEFCWIGANAVILPGVELGPRTIVGSGAVVTKSFKQGSCVIAGNPAKILRRL
jgi:acetyltransferase-like isoleucine patch superfamily enzyme